MKEKYNLPVAIFLLLTLMPNLTSAIRFSYVDAPVPQFPSPQASPPYTVFYVTGYVLYPSGKAVAGALVSLEVSGVLRSSTRTNDSGYYRLHAYAGNYTFYVTSSSYLNYTESDFFVTGNMTKNITLTYASTPPKTDQADVYVGIDVAYGGASDIKGLIDQINPYTNLIVFGVSALTNNETNLWDSCQYAYDKRMYFIPYQPGWLYRSQPVWNLSYNDAKAIWGSHLLGTYLLDEPGGKEVDRHGTSGSYIFIYNQTNTSGMSYSQLTQTYEQTINYQLALYAPDIPTFTSDYALYWFDYKAGYSTVFAEFTMNNSRQLQIALARGAAAMQGKEWGIMITWDYDSYPYMEPGDKLYQDMVIAYNNGAKYIIVFDSNQAHTASVLKPEHYLALQQFWQYIHNNPRNTTPISDRTAYVMPSGYGFGFRKPDDKVWGQTDSTSSKFYNSAIALLSQYGEKLDIIYEDEASANNVSHYNSTIFYNNYTPPTPTASPTSSSTPIPTASSSPTQTASPTPATLPTPTPTLTSLSSPSPSPTPNSSPAPTSSPSSPTQRPTTSPSTELVAIADNPIWTLYMAIAAVVSISSVAAYLFIRKKRQAKITKPNSI